MTEFVLTSRNSGRSIVVEADSEIEALARIARQYFDVERRTPLRTVDEDLFGNVPALMPLSAEPTLEEFVAKGWEHLKENHPGVAAIQAMTDKRKKAMGARAKEIAKAVKDPKWQNPKVVWERIFHEITKSQFLTGRAPPGRGRTAPFKLTIDYVVRPSEFAKIFEGAYDDTTGRNIERTHDEHTGREIGPAERAARAYVENNRSRFVPSR